LRFLIGQLHDLASAIGKAFVHVSISFRNLGTNSPWQFLKISGVCVFNPSVTVNWPALDQSASMNSKSVNREGRAGTQLSGFSRAVWHQRFGRSLTPLETSASIRRFIPLSYSLVSIILGTTVMVFFQNRFPDVFQFQSQILQHMAGYAICFSQQAQENMFCSNIRVIQLSGFLNRVLNHLFGPRRLRQFTGSLNFRPKLNQVLDFISDSLQIDGQILQDFCGDNFFIFHKP
jgi:hypothetical protein